MNKNKLAKVLYAARINRGLTIRAVRRRSKNKISIGYISHLERGVQSNISALKLRHLAKALKLQYSKLVKLAGLL